MYTMNLETSFFIKELLESIEELNNSLTITPEIAKVIEKAEKLDNMKQFLKDNL